MTREEAAEQAEAQYRAFVALVMTVGEQDWTSPTDCTLWDVRALVGHNLGNMEAAASLPVTLRQQARALLRSRREGITPVDAMTAIQVDDAAPLGVHELLRRLEAVVPKAVRGRRRLPGPIRRLKVDMGEGRRRPLADLVDVIYSRDAFMHRIDLSRALGRPLDVVPDHDARLVAGVVDEWAANHGRPFVLTLTGPAGGRFEVGEGGEELELDAVDFCRIVAGRAEGEGLLATKVLF